MALFCCLSILAQLLLLIGLGEALDISYCSPDNTGSDFQQGELHASQRQISD
jgi:hypothetical protein